MPATIGSCRIDFTSSNWNLNAFTSNRDNQKIRLLERLNWNDATVQELIPATIERVQVHHPEWRIFTGVPTLGVDRPGRRRRAGVIVKPEIQVSALLSIECDDNDLEGRAAGIPHEVLAAVEIIGGGTRIAIASAHPPHAAATSDEERSRPIARKLRIYEALARWAAPRTHVVVGMDANAWLDQHPYEHPQFDYASPQVAVDRFFREEPPSHGLRDAFRIWLEERPDELTTIRDRRPQGPLALTYVRGGDRKVADRFDVFMVSSTLRVDSIEHNYQDAVAAGSDHAYVLAEFSLV